MINVERYATLKTNFIKPCKWKNGIDLSYEFETFSTEFLAYRAMIYIYIDLNSNALGRVTTSVSELLAMANMTDMKNRKIYQTYSLLFECLNWFVESGYFKLVKHGKEISVKKLEKSKPTEVFYIDVDIEQFGPKMMHGCISEPFIQVDTYDFEALIAPSRIDNCNQLNRFLIFLHILSRIWVQYDSCIKCGIFTIDDLVEDTYMNRKTIIKHIKSLENIGVIHRRQISGKKSPYVYVLDTPDWKSNLEEGIKLMK